MPYNHTTIAVIGGGISNEREISIKSAQNVAESLERMGLNFVMLDPTTKDFFSTPFDIAFNCLHGEWGEDGGLQGYCNLRKIPFTGPGLTAATGFNKVLFKYILQQSNIIVPKQILSPDRFPLIVKPKIGGSSLGIHIVKSTEEWTKLIQKTPLILTPNYFYEEYISGQEVSCGLIKIKNEIVVFPIIEIKPTCEFYSYEAKYTKGKTNYLLPANVHRQIQEKISSISKEIYAIFDCKGCIRLDFIINNNTPYVLEMNTNPGISKGSIVPKITNHMGIGFDELVQHYLNSAQ
jgi:D-alanine-D-alanine ligase